MVSDTQTIPVFFSTQTPYPLPSQKFMIPASWKRYQLSQLVNKALSLLQPIPFDFLVRGELLRGSLAEWCNERDAGAEETLEIEYIESLMPPQRMANIPHDDWISSVSAQIHGHFVTGSYDAAIRIFDSSQNVKLTITGHSAPITSVHILPSDSEERIIASASQDMTARLTSISITSDEAPRTLASLHLHSAPISHITSSSSGSHLLTAGWDSLLGLWDTSIPESDEVTPEQGERDRKKRKRDTEGVKRKAPVAVLKSHTGRVTASVFDGNDDNKAYSCGLDSTLRSWDVESGVCVNTLTAPEKPFIALAYLSSTPSILAAASVDRTVTVYDTRTISSQKSVSAAATIASLAHAATPSSLAASPVNAHHIASGAFDGIVRIWDVRSVKSAMASFRVGTDKDKEQRGDGKVLGLDWVKGVLAVGGEAGLDIWRVPEEGARSN